MTAAGERGAIHLGSQFEKRRPRVVAFLTDGMWSHDVANAIQVFGGSLSVSGENPCDFCFVAENPSVELDHGISVRCTPLVDFEGSAALVCIPGFSDPLSLDDRLMRERGNVPAWRDTGAPAARVTPEVLAWLSGMWATGAQLVSLGTGAFLLALAGLLDGVTCTTHWVYAAELARRFPKVHVDATRLLTHDRKAHIRTSAGGASGADACLAGLMDIAGLGAASSVSSAMNLWSPRSDDARQDALGMPDIPAEEQLGEGMAQLKDAVRRHMDHGWSIAEMAWYTGMSTRSFQRHFTAVVGQTPAKWLVSERVLRAAHLLEETDLPLPVLAARVGLSSADVLRRHFIAAYGESPSAYRKRFR